jgi:hypothetical protein
MSFALSVVVIDFAVTAVVPADLALSCILVLIFLHSGPIVIKILYTSSIASFVSPITNFLLSSICLIAILSCFKLSVSQYFSTGNFKRNSYAGCKVLEYISPSSTSVFNIDKTFCLLSLNVVLTNSSLFFVTSTVVVPSVVDVLVFDVVVVDV